MTHHESERTRRDFLATAGLTLGAVALGAPSALATLQPQAAGAGAPLFRISLAQWSLHRALRSGALKPINFPEYSHDTFGIDAVEYVSTFYKDHVTDREYITDLKKRCSDLGVRSLLIMVDGEGALGDPDQIKRKQAVENHYKWVEVAEFLGCHSIRVNAQSSGPADAQRALVVDGLRRLCAFADGYNINVIVENHGGLSSNGRWLASVMRAVHHDRCGTLPDFGNFRIQGDEWYDRYVGVRELMPFAKAVSAKSHAFDEEGNETGTDYERMMRIVLDAGYNGYVGIEYEGAKTPEDDGIRATKTLLERVREQFADRGLGRFRAPGATSRPATQPEDQSPLDP